MSASTWLSGPMEEITNRIDLPVKFPRIWPLLGSAGAIERCRRRDSTVALGLCGSPRLTLPVNGRGSQRLHTSCQ